jgi:hypothetical protein
MTSTPSDCFPFQNPCAPGDNIGYTAVSVEPGKNNVSKDVGFKYFIGIKHADKLEDFSCTVDRQGLLNIKYNYISGFNPSNTDYALQGTDLIKYEEVVFPAGQFGNIEISPDTTILIKINDLRSSDSLSNQLSIKLETRKDALPQSDNKVLTFSYVRPPMKMKKKKENNDAVEQGKDTSWWVGTIVIITFAVLFLLYLFLTRRRN